MRREYDGYFKIDRATFIEPGVCGKPSREIVRYVFERGDSSAVLLHDATHETVVLVRQIRYPAVLRNTDGRLLEIVAGAMTPDEDPSVVAIREVAEETGVTIRDPNFLGMIFLSPGGSTERCFLYESAIDSTGLQGRIGGEPGTDEETHVEVIAFKDAFQMIRSGVISDAKTVITLQKIALGEIPGWHLKD